MAPMMKKLKDEEYWGKILLVLMIVLISGFGFFEYYKQKNIHLYQAHTTGKVTEFLKNGGARFSIKYEYQVNDKSFEGFVGVRSFKCDNGRKGCVGEVFKVYYSTENPEYSRINLGKYEQYKNTVEFFD